MFKTFNQSFPYDEGENFGKHFEKNQFRSFSDLTDSESKIFMKKNFQKSQIKTFYIFCK